MQKMIIQKRRKNKPNRGGRKGRDEDRTSGRDILGRHMTLARKATGSPESHTRPCGPWMRANEAGGERAAGDATTGPEPDAEPRSLSRHQQRPAIDCSEPEEALLLVGYFLTMDFFLLVMVVSVGRGGKGGRSSIPEKVGQRGRASILEQTQEMGVPVVAAFPQPTAPKSTSPCTGTSTASF